MIGNDIVDLALARKDSNWQRKGFLDKLFTQNEQLLITNAKSPELMVWNLWSRKEAAYKIYNRETGIRGYFPLQIECSYENESKGTVFCKGQIYFTATTVEEEFIYTVAVAKPSYFSRVAKIKSDSKINKTNGIPFVIDAVTLISKPISITHHGRFGEGITV